MCASAVRLCKSAGYYNAGTVEFLVDAKGRFYFIEVNARIQVEHPVTELVTGIDLVQSQIRIAMGEPLGFAQKNITSVGHAIECRVNAEDPSANFRPNAGSLELFRPPGGPGVRVDTFAHDGCRVSRYYDSLLAKLIVHHPTREGAIRAMQRCLREFRIEPLKTTIPFLEQVMAHPEFIKGGIDTGFVERSLTIEPARQSA